MIRVAAIAIGLLVVTVLGGSILWGGLLDFSICNLPDETQASPTRSWIAELLSDSCSGEFVKLALRHPNEKSAQDRNVFFSANLQRSQATDVLFRWLDDSNLMIALPEGGDNEK